LLWVYCHYLEMRQTVIFSTTDNHKAIWHHKQTGFEVSTLFDLEKPLPEQGLLRRRLVFLKMKKQWKLLQKVKMKQIYWRHHALKKTRFSYQYQFSLLQSLLWQQQLIIIVLVQFISYIQCGFNYMSESQKSSSSFNKQIKNTPSSSLVMQQLTIYMFISTFESTEALHFNDMNVMNFLET